MRDTRCNGEKPGEDVGAAGVQPRHDLRSLSPRGRGRLLAVAYPWEVAGRQDHPAVKQPTLLESRGGSHGGFQGEGGRDHRNGFLAVKPTEVQYLCFDKGPLLELKE